jgi:hypothetical protein
MPSVKVQMPKECQNSKRQTLNLWPSDNIPMTTSLFELWALSFI